jgi:hypothetical protein
MGGGGEEWFSIINVTLTIRKQLQSHHNYVSLKKKYKSYLAIIFISQCRAMIVFLASEYHLSTE